MKKAFLGLMALIMLTPSLACAMDYCPMRSASEQASNDMSNDMPNDMPCHNQTDANDGIMLVLDCMGVDLFNQDISDDLVSFQPQDTPDYSWIGLASSYNFNPRNINAIRGPPEILELAQTQPSIIITTQRLRI